jgi:hypothetical protein
MSSAVTAAGAGVGEPKSGAACVPVPAGTVRQILKRVDRAVAIGERELRYQLDRKHDHPLANSTELLFVLAELEELGLVEAELCFRLTDRGRQRLTEPNEHAHADVGLRFAAMEDDTVLCAECVAEVSELQLATADTLVHAWIDPAPGTGCRWCGTTATLDDEAKGVGS